MSTNDGSVYRSSLIRHFEVLKKTSTLDEAMAKSLRLRGSGGFLLAVSELHASERRSIRLLSQWRRENEFAFPTRFRITEEGTAAWLRAQLLDVPDRILFFVLDRFGEPLGHLGLWQPPDDDRLIMIDNVVRGVKDRCAGIMGEALRTMLSWTEEMLRPNRIALKVFSDNEHAIEFYRRHGFSDEFLIPLTAVEEPGRTVYLEADANGPHAPDKYFLRMGYVPRREAGREMIMTAGPSISARETWYALDAARDGWGSNCYGYLERLETSFAAHLGTRHAIATSSWTGALHIALRALGIGPGDEVVVPDLTWVATANAVIYAGAIPIFADVQEKSWCLDPVSFERCITSRTKAVIAVHLYGYPAEMDRIMQIASSHGLFVIEDAAAALGAEFHGTPCGTFGHFAAFSFQGAKLLVAGEGGMLVTRDPELYSRALSLSNQGRRPGTFQIVETGYKYKMSNVQAAVALAQLERADELVEAKRRIHSLYSDALAGIPGIEFQRPLPAARSACWMNSILLPPESGVHSEEFRRRLKARNIDSRPVFPPLSQFGIWPKEQARQPISAAVGNSGINLPSGVTLQRAQVEYISGVVRRVLERGHSPADGDS